MMEGHDIPTFIYNHLVGRKLKDLSYSTDAQGDQLTHITMILEGTGRFSEREIKLEISLDCNEARHSMKFIV